MEFRRSSWHCPKVENDWQIGGSYCARVWKPRTVVLDSTLRLPTTRLLCIKTKLYDCRWTKGNGIISPSANKTVSVTFEPETQNPMDLQRNGWQAILDHYRTHVNSLWKELKNYKPMRQITCCKLKGISLHSMLSLLLLAALLKNHVEKVAALACSLAFTFNPGGYHLW